MEEELKNTAAEAEAAEATATDSAENDTDAAKKILALEKKLAEVEAALTAEKAAAAELSDKHLRLAAEYDNFRRRSLAEKTAAYTDGLDGALEKFLPILDNMERASLYTDAAGVAEGLAITVRSAAEALASLGVEEFGKEGDAFDPNLHNAVMHVDDDARGESEISAVHQKGYKKGDRILRYAMVTVAN